MLRHGRFKVLLNCPLCRALQERLTAWHGALETAEHIRAVVQHVRARITELCENRITQLCVLQNRVISTAIQGMKLVTRPDVCLTV
jgi:hypothetical protein